MKITLVAGTSRPGSNTRKVTSCVEIIYSELGHPVQLLDLAQLPPNLFTEESWETTPPEFQRFVDMIAASDGIHFVTPEYNSGIPGVLKYFIDMLDVPDLVRGKCVAMTGLAAGQWGGLHSVQHLQGIMGALGCHVFTTRVFIPGVRKALNEEGQLVEETLTQRLRSQAAGFLDFTAKLRGATSNGH